MLGPNNIDALKGVLHLALRMRLNPMHSVGDMKVSIEPIRELDSILFDIV